MRVTDDYALGDDADSFADSLSPLLVYAGGSSNDMRSGDSGDYASYEIDIPVAGSWFLWARMYYPGRPGSNDANSFFVRVDGGAPLKLGNNKEFFRVWHWDGDGNIERGAPSPLPLGDLADGIHEIAIAKREVLPVAPRLDLFVLTQDPEWVPTDDLVP